MSEAPPNRELVIYVLSLLGGESNRLHTEDIAVKCHELFPESFSWTKHTQHPDKDIVRVALTDARKAQYGALVEGRSGQKHGQSARTRRNPVPDGWMLTDAGVRWVTANKENLEALAGGSALKAHRQVLLKQLAKVRRHPLFLTYLEKPDAFSPPLGEMADLVRCRVDAPQEVWMTRFDSIRQKAMAAEQRDVSDFIARCRAAYAQQR